jgi:penicillin-binding protein 1A
MDAPKGVETFPMLGRRAAWLTRSAFGAASPQRNWFPRRRPLLVLLIAVALGSLIVALGVVPFVGASQLAVHQVNRHLGVGDALALPPLEERSTIYAADGSVLANVSLDQNREIVPLAAVDQVARLAVLAIEDHAFFQHGPLDARAIVRALVADLKARAAVEGGSTIAQQLAKNVETGSARTLARKIAEARDAIRLERTYTKDQILAMYLNQIYLGNGVYGIGTAAPYYFGVPASKLVLPQAALLAGMIASPEVYNPFRHPKAAEARRNEVLGRMLEFGSISTRQYLQAIRAPLRLSRRVRTANPLGSEPYFVQYVERQFLGDPRFGPALPDREQALFEGGLRIYTTLEPRLQSEARAAVQAHLPSPADPEAAVVTIAPSTGAIEAMVSGRNFGRRQFNLATQAHRSAGSAFKVFTLTAALEQGISPDTAFSSASPITIPDCAGTGVEWHVANAEPGTGGSMTLWDGIKFSVNVVFAQLINRVGPKAVAATAHRMGIGSPLALYCPLTLGASPVSPLEMTSAYSTLANGGSHCQPYVIARIESRTGQTLYQAHPQCTQVIPSGIAAQVTAMLERVVQGGTGTAADIGRPQAGKTGTAENFQDAWFMGYVPQLCTGIWVGFPRAEIPMLDVHGQQGFGGVLAAPIWHDYMAQATEGLASLGFPPPPSPLGGGGVTSLPPATPSP